MWPHGKTLSQRWNWWQKHIYDNQKLDEFHIRNDTMDKEEISSYKWYYWSIWQDAILSSIGMNHLDL